MGGGEGEDEAGVVTSIEEEDGGVHGEAILAAMPVPGERARRDRRRRLRACRNLRCHGFERAEIPSLACFERAKALTRLHLFLKTLVPLTPNSAI